MDWAEAQVEDPTLSAVLDWLGVQKKTNLKALLIDHASHEENQLILRNCQNFMIYQGVLYLHSMPKGKTEDLLLCLVPKLHWVANLNGCHRDAGYRAITILCHCFGSASSGQEWLIRCSNPSKTSCVAYNMRANYRKCLYIQLCPLLHWTSYT